MSRIGWLAPFFIIIYVSVAHHSSEVIAENIKWSRHEFLKTSDGNRYFESGRTHLKQKQFAEAVEDFTHAINNGIHTTDVFIYRGDAYFKLEQYKEAIADFTEALKRDSTNPVVYMLRGFSYYYIKRYQDSINDMTKAISINPRVGLFYTARSGNYLAIGEANQALEDLNKAIILGEKSASVFHDRGLAFNLLGRYEEAVGSFSEALKVEASHYGSLINRGFLYLCLGNPEKAIDDGSIVLEINPRDLQAYRQRAAAYSAIKDFKRALNDLDRLIELGAQDAWTYLAYADVYFHMGEIGRAEEANKKALSLNDEKTLVETYFQKGLFLLTRGMTEEAGKAYEKGIALSQSALSLYRLDEAIKNIRDTQFASEQVEDSAERIIHQLEQALTKAGGRANSMPNKCDSLRDLGSRQGDEKNPFSQKKKTETPHSSKGSNL